MNSFGVFTNNLCMFLETPIEDLTQADIQQITELVADNLNHVKTLVDTLQQISIQNVELTKKKEYLKKQNQILKQRNDINIKLNEDLENSIVKAENQSKKDREFLEQKCRQIENKYDELMMQANKWRGELEEAEEQNKMLQVKKLICVRYDTPLSSPQQNNDEVEELLARLEETTKRYNKVNEDLETANKKIHLLNEQILILEDALSQTIENTLQETRLDMKCQVCSSVCLREPEDDYIDLPVPKCYSCNDSMDETNLGNVGHENFSPLTWQEELKLSEKLREENIAKEEPLLPGHFKCCVQYGDKIILNLSDTLASVEEKRDQNACVQALLMEMQSLIKEFCDDRETPTSTDAPMANDILSFESKGKKNKKKNAKSSERPLKIQRSNKITNSFGKLFNSVDPEPPKPETPVKLMKSYAEVLTRTPSQGFHSTYNIKSAN